MKVEIEIPEPAFKLAVNEKLVNRGFGWHSEKPVKYYTLLCSIGQWSPPAIKIPSGYGNLLYFEVVETFPMPPEELDGFKLEYVKREDLDSLANERYAVLRPDESGWRITPSKFHVEWLEQGVGCDLSYPHALATPIVCEERDKKLALVAELEEKLEQLKGELSS